VSNKILLVEDEALIAINEAQMLKKHGYEVVTAYNGEKAIKAVDSDHEISLILMDLDLGKGMDGTEAAEQILNKKDIPVVFLSSHTEPEVVEKTEGITSYGYIVKNSGETVLLASIRMAFRLFDARMKEKEHKEALLHSHSLMSYIIEHSQSAVAVHDRDLKYIYVSKQYLNQFNVEKRDVIGKHHYEVFPDLPQKWREVHRRALFGEVSKGEDDPYEHEDGTIEWTRWECRPWYEADGTIGGFIIYTEVISKEKQTKFDVRDNTNYMQSVLRTTQDGFWVLDTEGNFIDVNRAYCEMSGYSRDQILQMKVPDIDAEERPEDTADRINRIISTGSEIFQARHRRKEGSIFDVEISASFLGGKQDKFVCFCRDITERRRAEEKLKKNEMKYRGLFNSIRDAILVTDTDRNIVDCNSAFTELFGYTLEEIKGEKPLRVYAHEEEYTRIGRAIKQQNRDLSKSLFTIQYKKKDGKVFPGESNVFYLQDDAGNVYGIVGLVRDITERKQTEKKEQELRERLRKIIDNSPLSIIEINSSGHYVLVNEATCALLNTTKEKLLGKHFEEVVPPETASVYKERIDYVSKTGGMMTVDDTLHIDRQEQIVRTVLFPIYRHGDSLPSIIGIAYAITKEMQLLREKEFLMKELNHRVKNNLAMVSSLINLKDSETEADLSDIQHQVGAISLIHEKLYQTGNITEIGFQDYISDLLNSIFSSFSKRLVKIEANIGEISIPTKSAMSLGLIVNEIATNAIKYGFNEKEEAVFSINMKEDRKNNRYELTLSNTGNPFPKDIDVENPQTLGLRLISALTEQLGGTLELKREPNTVFAIRFPIEEE